METRRRYRRWIVPAVCGLSLLYFGSALGMIALPMPRVADANRMTRAEAEADGMTVEQRYEFEPCGFATRDGIRLYGRRFTSPSADSIVFLHGASGHSSQLNKCAGMLREATGMEVFAYDHRGHGASPGPRGDVAFVGQYATDVADVLQAVRTLKPEGRILLAGHSMGGGIAQRYAMSSESQLADAYLLFAPAMGRGLPGDKIPDIARPHLPRIFGLLMLNAVGIRGFNHEPVVTFAFPDFDGHITEYSYAAVRSMLPHDFRVGLAAIEKPLLVVLGAGDMARGVDPVRIAEAVRTYSRGAVVIVEGEGHHVHNAPQAIDTAAAWISETFD
jgi:pimeloyl-ACP methyl ester carboxylesterase